MVEDGGRPGRRRSSEWGTGPSFPESPWVPKARSPAWDPGAEGPGPGGAEGPPARAARTGPAGSPPSPVRLVRALLPAGHPGRRRRAGQSRETEASPGAPSAASSSGPRQRPGAPRARECPRPLGKEDGCPRAPRPGPPPDRPAEPPLTTETWRPGPGRRRSGARGSQLWVPRLGDGGRGPGRGGRERRPGRAPAATFLFPAAGGGAGRGRGGPGALTLSALPPSHPSAARPAVPPLCRTARPPLCGQWPISRRRNPRPDPAWPSRNFGAREGRFRPRLLGLLRGASLWSSVPPDACEPGDHSPPTFQGPPGPHHLPLVPFGTFLR